MNENENTNSIKGFIFEHELYKMICKHPDFTKIKVDDVFNGITPPADILVEYKNQPYIIECNVLPVFSGDRLGDIIINITQYRKYLKEHSNAKLVLAFPGELNKYQHEQLSANMIEVWDINKIVEIFACQISEIQSVELKELLLSVNKNVTTIEENLSNEITTCPKGNLYWAKYQKICTNIFEYLFCPPLGRPITELSDYAKANRRDIILPNYCENGFWSYLRQRYRADYIIIDAKNHASKIEKSFVLQMANYLKDYGAGMFGIITCRSNIKESTIHTQREVWVAQHKLIIFLNDNDLENMLKAKKNSNSAEEIIKQKIEDFRLSL